MDVLATKSDFHVKVGEVRVNVFFQPTQSHFTYMIHTNPVDIARYGRLGRQPHIHHGKTGDTREYDAIQVEEMAFFLATEVVSNHRFGRWPPPMGIWSRT
jgi:hypothetical protein